VVDGSKLPRVSPLKFIGPLACAAPLPPTRPVNANGRRREESRTLQSERVAMDGLGAAWGPIAWLGLLIGSEP
jgi:hypothetical protein